MTRRIEATLMHILKAQDRKFGDRQMARSTHSSVVQVIKFSFCACPTYAISLRRDWRYYCWCRSILEICEGQYHCCSCRSRRKRFIQQGPPLPHSELQTVNWHKEIQVKHGVMFDRKESEGTKRRHQVDTVVEGMYAFILILSTSQCLIFDLVASIGWHITLTSPSPSSMTPSGDFHPWFTWEY